MSVGDIKSAEEFKKIINEDRVILVHFWVPWAKECPVMNEALDELSKEEPRGGIYRLEAEEVKDVPTEYGIHAVPTFIFFKKGQVLERIDGAHPVKVVNALKRLIDSPTPSTILSSSAAPTVDKTPLRCKTLINSEPVIMFMKGNRAEPKCKFSRAAMEILNSYGNLKFATFDILLDDQIRQGLKEYSNWPTYPQLYINGELVGGVDILKELHESKELEGMFPKKKDLDERLKELTNQSPVVVFMKGNPSNPKCGFSRQLIEIFKPLNVEYTTFDILGDEEVRQGLKTFSNWPTYPQVYVKGELIGGLDIIKELEESSDLLSALKGE